MKKHNRRVKQVRRIKVAVLAAYSRAHTVRNINKTISSKKTNGEWDIPEKGYPQPKIWKTNIPDYVFRTKGHAWFMEQMVQHKIAKWEKKNPQPVKANQNPPDMFEQEYMIPWKEKRELALEHFRDFVVSIYDKLPLTGRFQKSDNEFVEEHMTNIKDVNTEGHKINELDSKKSKLLKIAQKETNKIKQNRPNLVCTVLKDHQRKKGRIILPKAA